MLDGGARLAIDCRKGRIPAFIKDQGRLQGPHVREREQKMYKAGYKRFSVWSRHQPDFRRAAGGYPGIRILSVDPTPHHGDGSEGG